jgi:hypothetical protein
VGNKQKNNFRKLLHTFKGLKILNRTTFLQTPSLNYWFELIRKIMLVLICGFSFLCSQTAFYSFQLECQCLETFFLSSQRLFLLIIFCSELYKNKSSAPIISKFRQQINYLSQGFLKGCLLRQCSNHIWKLTA